MCEVLAQVVSVKCVKSLRALFLLEEVRMNCYDTLPTSPQPQHQYEAHPCIYLSISCIHIFYTPAPLLWPPYMLVCSSLNTHTNTHTQRYLQILPPPLALILLKGEECGLFRLVHLNIYILYISLAQII